MQDTLLFHERINHLLIRTLNIQIKKFQPGIDHARLSLFERNRFSLVIDGGANEGQWSLPLVEKFPKLLFHSFEPYSKAFDRLAEASRGHENWMVHNLALGEQAGRSNLQVSTNKGMSSSLLKPSAHITAFPEVEFNGIETVSVVRLDDITELYGPKKYLKLDLQGAENLALKGATNLLREVEAIEIEMTLTPMYEGEKSLSEMLKLLESLGFSVFHLFTPAIEPNGKCNYVDVLLTRD